ncbi:multicopper oxidase family protein [Streptomyces hundungensis]|uniref:multicopper oxidase family protein n=1 Tax=Streptomyces hundungensis TaxID=1077946 RepID=UPI0034004C38
MATIGRRTVLRGFPAAVAASMAAGQHALAVESLTATPTRVEDAFPQPDVRSSRRGALSTSLAVRFTELDLPGFDPIRTRTYEGSVPGPTLRLRAGERLELSQINGLPPNHDDAGSRPYNHPHAFNTFNLHTHGLHVDPGGIADNVLRAFPPAARHGARIPAYRSVIDIPRDHPDGTFWYHPHHHGSSATQLAGGMAGVIVIEGATDQVPQIAAAREVVVCVNELKLVERLPSGWEVPDLTSERALSTAKPVFLVNGAVRPTISAVPGEVQRWRLVNAGGFTALALTLNGHKLHEIARDGITFARPAPRDAIRLPMGGRSDILVQAGPEGTYDLRSGDNTLMTLHVKGEPLRRPMALPTTLPGRPTTLRAPDRKRALAFRSYDKALYGAFPNAYRILGTGETPHAKPSDGIHDTRWGRFDPHFVNHTLRLGDVEEWTLTNPSGSHSNHPFHLHTNHFLVMSVNGRPLTPPIWHDTVSVPQNGEVVIRVRYEDFTGTTVLHCHQLQHEDEGMMQLIQYVR